MWVQSSGDPHAPALSSLRGTRPSPVPAGGIRAQPSSAQSGSHTGQERGGKHPVPLDGSPLDRAQTSW